MAIICIANTVYNYSGWKRIRFILLSSRWYMMVCRTKNCLCVHFLCIELYSFCYVSFKTNCGCSFISIIYRRSEILRGRNSRLHRPQYCTILSAPKQWNIKWLNSNLNVTPKEMPLNILSDGLTNLEDRNFSYE